MSEQYEYGIAHIRLGPSDPHRTEMTYADALAWINFWLEDGGQPGVFVVIRRPVGPWELADARDEVMCTTGDHEDVPAVGDALSEAPDENRYPYCAECLDTLGRDYEPRRWSD